jgi:predicted nucleotidyltransferase
LLIPPSSKKDEGGGIRNLESDFAVVITPGLHLAFRDFEEVTIQGETLTSGQATRTFRVCGPGAFIVLKALAFRGRGANKDAYDLWYLLQHRADATERLNRLVDDPTARLALSTLEDDFASADRVGPRRAAMFLSAQADDHFQADFAGLVRSLLAALPPR